MYCWASRLFYLMVVALGLVSMIGACGQKGPLYLPEEPPPQAAPPTVKVGADVPTEAASPSATAPPAKTP